MLDIFPGLSEHEHEERRREVRVREATWLVQRIVAPEYPKILDTLNECLRCLEDSPEPNPLALSLYKTESVKGLIVREHLELTKLDFILKLKGMPKSVRYVLQRPLKLPQIEEAVRLIATATEQAERLFQSLQDGETVHQGLKQLLESITLARLAVQTPTPGILFPKHVIDREAFEPVLPTLVALDVYVQDTLIGVDVRLLEEVTEKPWSEVNEDGVSYVDEMKQKVLRRKRSITTLFKPGEGSGQHNLFRDTATQGGLMQLLLHPFAKYLAEEYMTRCVTYDRTVVMEVDKAEVQTFDPVLVRCGTKLDGLHGLVQGLYENLRVVRG